MFIKVLHDEGFLQIKLYICNEFAMLRKSIEHAHGLVSNE